MTREGGQNIREDAITPFKPQTPRYRRDDDLYPTESSVERTAIRNHRKETEASFPADITAADLRLWEAIK